MSYPDHDIYHWALLPPPPARHRPSPIFSVESFSRKLRALCWLR